MASPITKGIVGGGLAGVFMASAVAGPLGWALGATTALTTGSILHGPNKG